jgi:hypothetical protein
MFSGTSEPLHFASQEAQEALKRAMEAMRSDMPGQLASLRGELLDLLRGKADREDLQALRRSAAAMAALARERASEGGPVSEDPALHRVQLLPARCISCDKLVEFTSGRPHPCHGATPSWPRREGASCPLHQAPGPPPGYRQRRAPSLPALPSSPTTASALQPQPGRGGALPTLSPLLQSPGADGGGRRS